MTERSLPRTIAANLGSLVLPATAAGLAPYLLGRGDGRPPSLASAAAGLPPVLLGLFLLGWTVTLFIRIGRGTLAPWDPTRRLGVVGPYAHVRNPMISGVMALIAGE